ncbi:MAG: Na+/H+ antiporter subunit E [Anaerolineae bacterium]|jgi:multicomponent Na+:H+ antiporter subunit E
MAIWMVVGLWLVYLALTANLELGNVVLGLLVATGLTLLLRPPRGTFELRRLPGALVALGRYIFVVLIDAIKSGLVAARLVLDPALPVKPGIIAIPSDCDSELATALSAHAITLAPGEMVVEIGKDGTMYAHALDATRAAEYVEEAQEQRRGLLRKIFP